MFKVYNFKKLNSTFNKAKNFEINSVIIAQEQTKGKGRFKRKWTSQKGGIYLSIVLPKFNPAYLTFIAAIAANKAIKDIYNIKTTIKWPNDLLYQKKKLCGILTVIKDKAIVGIGINTNNEISIKKAISLKEVVGKKINNKLVINKLLANFEFYLKLLEKKKYSKIIKDWKELSFLKTRIKVKTLNKTHEGIAYDIDKDCFLILKTKSGKKIKIIEGDVFVE